MTIPYLVREDWSMRLSFASLVVAATLATATTPAFAGKPVAVDRDTTNQKLSNLIQQIGLMKESIPPGYGRNLWQARRKLEELTNAVNTAPPAEGAGNVVVVDRDSFVSNVRWAMGLVTSLRNDPACTQWADALAPWGDDLVNYVNAARWGRRRPPGYVPPPSYAPPPPAPTYAPPPAQPVYAPPPAQPVYAPPPPVVYAQPVGPQAMDGGSFGQLLSTVGNEAFDSSKLNVIRTATANYFTCNQVAQLLGKFTFDDSKVKAVEILASRIIDRGNAFVLYNSFTFSSSKDRVRQILR